MRTNVLCFLALVCTPVASAMGQRADSAGERRADSLRHRIEERFAARVQQQLGLTNQQTSRLRTTSETFGTRRRELRDRERAIRDALRQQLQPGVAANSDSVAKLTDALIELKLASAQTARDEMREVSKFLNPVQRARLFVMREDFHHRVRSAHGHRGMDHRGKGGRRRDRSWM